MDIRTRSDLMSSSRRQFLANTLGASGVLLAAEQSWHRGVVRHLLPAVSHNRLLLKASFDHPQTAAPVLRAGNRNAAGVRMDTTGEFYSFDITGLEPQRTYQL